MNPVPRLLENVFEHLPIIMDLAVRKDTDITDMGVQVEETSRKEKSRWPQLIIIIRKVKNKSKMWNLWQHRSETSQVSLKSPLAAERMATWTWGPRLAKVVDMGSVGWSQKGMHGDLQSQCAVSNISNMRLGRDMSPDVLHTSPPDKFFVERHPANSSVALTQLWWLLPSSTHPYSWVKWNYLCIVWVYNKFYTVFLTFCP